MEDVANYIIKLANAEIDPDFDNNTEWITHLKLQKILYFVQATFLATKWEKAFEEKIMAWSYWPVIREIYNKYRDVGRSFLSVDTNFNENIFSDEDKELLQKIRRSFGRYSATQLVSMTHSHSPRKHSKQSEEIDPEKIKSFYMGKILID